MTIAQRKLMSVQKSQSLIRSRVLELRGMEEAKLTPEVRTERDTLDRRYGSGEEEYRHALSDVEAEEIKALAGGDAEDLRKLRSLIRDRSSPGRILRGGSCDDRAITLTVKNRSCKQHYKVGEKSKSLMALLRTEHRSVTAAPSGRS